MVRSRRPSGIEEETVSAGGITAAQHLTTFHQPARILIKVIPSMQHPAIVPDDEIIGLPLLPLDILFEGGV